MTTEHHTNLERLRQDFYNLRNPDMGLKRKNTGLQTQESGQDSNLEPWQAFSLSAEMVYPSQGVLTTAYDYIGNFRLQELDREVVTNTLVAREFFLHQSNHRYRLENLLRVSAGEFVPPPKIGERVFSSAQISGDAIAIGDLVAVVGDGLKSRVSRNERYANGPFIKLGRQARMPFVGSENPDVWGSACAVATMAASHCIATIPRNGLLHDIKRQQDFALEVYDWLDKTAETILAGREDRYEVLSLWKNNIVGTLEPTFEKAIKRAEHLMEVGVTSFRIYSPEPGNAIVNTAEKLRRELGDEIEIFAGQVVSVNQAKALNNVGVDLIVVGIGGGGRCTTPMRSGVAVDWPELVWDLRGEIDMPVVVQGGGSDHVATSLLLGASAIGVSRAVAGGTIESPGGLLYCVDSEGRYFKIYGGEASARMKSIENKLLPFGIPSFVEGETTKAYADYLRHTFPTLTHNLHHLTEEVILALVFQETESINELHSINPTPLRRVSAFGNFQRNTH